MKLVGSSKAVRSPEFHKRKLWETRLKAAGIILLALVVLVGPILLLRNSRLVISAVEVRGNEVTPDADIERIIADGLSGMYRKVIPRASALFYPKDAIAAAILNAFPRISHVDISLSGTRSIAVSVVERTPHALYCQSQSETCFFFDETGYIFSEAPNFSDGVYMVYATQPALETPVGTQLFKADELKMLELFLLRVRQLGMKLKTLTKEGNEFVLTQVAGPTLKWSADQDYDVLAVNLQSFLENGGFKPAEVKNMSYIDLRFGNKVFYKFEN